MSIDRTNNNNCNWNHIPVIRNDEITDDNIIGIAEHKEEDTAPKLHGDIIYTIINQFPKDAKNDLLPLRLVSNVFRDAVDHRLFAGTWTTFAENCPKEKPASFKNSFERYRQMAENLMPRGTNVQKFAKLVNLIRFQEDIDFPRQLKLPLTPADCVILEQRKIETDKALCILWDNLPEEIKKCLKDNPTANQIHYWMSVNEDKLQQIEVLDLNAQSEKSDEKRMRVLPPQIQHFKNLKFLKVIAHQISEIPEWIQHLEHLETLDLTLNFNITRIPEEIQFLTKLEELRLNYNQINVLPKMIKCLKNLKHLSLGYNRISEIPNKISECQNLKLLDLSYNSFNEFPIAITNITQLETLTISGLFKNGHPTELPESIKNLKQLKNLVLHDCQFIEIPEIIKDLPQLENLGFLHNYISRVPEWIQEMPALKDIHLSRYAKGQWGRIPAFYEIPPEVDSGKITYS